MRRILSSVAGLPAAGLQLVDPRRRGEIKSWKDNWGWIIGLGLEGDIFAHRSDFLCEAESQPLPNIPSA